MIFNKLALYTFTFLLLASYLATAQELDSDRPRVGLALSGGAAHGLAHIGVIKYLEEVGIEVDYITGTSMGSVIGGLHALGHDAEELADIADNMDWDIVMGNHIPLSEVAPIEKQDHERIPLTMLWNDKAFNLPRGFIRGQKLDLAISKVFCGAHLIDDYDKLHIPFRCVGVDIEDGSIDVFNSGYLGNSVRASMAIPSVFPPKLIDTTLYVDGGLIRNFPVQEAIDMGADIVIGVYVGSKNASKSELNSLLSVLKQAASMGNLIDSEEQKTLADILIEPDVKDYGSFDFKASEKFIELGYQAAKNNSKAFEKLAKKLEGYDSPERGPRLEVPSSFRISEIVTSEEDRAFEKMILNNLKVYEGYAVSLEQIEESISLIYGTKNFSKSSYSLYATEDQGLGLAVEVEDIVPFSLGVNVNRFELFNTALILSGEVRNVLGKPSNFRLSARISDNPGIQAKYFIRIPSTPQNLIQISGKAEKSELPFYTLNVLEQKFSNNEANLKIEVLREFSNTGLFSLGYQVDNNELQSAIDNDRIGEYQSIRNKVELSYQYNNLDRHSFSSAGINCNTSLSFTHRNKYSSEGNGIEELLLFEEDGSYANLDFSLNYYKPVLNKSTLVTKVKGRISTGQSLLDSYKVGGPFQEKSKTYGFIGLDDSELIVGDHFAVGMRLRIPVLNDLFISPTLDLLFGDNYLAQIYQYETQTAIVGVGAALEYDSPLGPVSFDLGYANLRERFTLNLGIGYKHIF